METAPASCRIRSDIYGALRLTSKTWHPRTWKSGRRGPCRLHSAGAQYSSSEAGRPRPAFKVYCSICRADVLLCLFSESFAKVLHQKHQLQFVNWRRLEIKVFVELSCSLIDRMDQDRPRSYDVGGVSDPQESVFQ